MSSKIAITLRRSCIGRPQKQKRVVAGLGLKRINHTVIKEDTPEIRGMIQKVSHLLTVGEAS